VAVRTGDGAIVEAEKALVAVGRTANIELLGLDKADILTRNGRIAVDGHLKTARANIYAIGDCVDGPQLAHKASYDAILACDNIMGKSRTVDYTNIPNCVWTEPEAAMVGMTEEEAKKTHPEARTAKFPYLGSGKAYIERKTEGYVKITGSPDGRILGVEILGKGACDLIGEAVLAKTYNITIEEWSRSVHAHPTLSESLQEAAHIFCGNAIHTI
jgi:dihydrolipoamide dehydrogenase